MLRFKNIIFSVGFLFRPMTPVAVSFAFLVSTCVLLVVIILNLNESTKVYQVLLSILTGVTASLLIAIMMELFNNYRFNTKRQRELREYFRQVASYELNQSSIIETNAKDKYDSVLGSGRSYAVFSQLKDIIPNLREVLNHRDYLYRLEIEEIDDILSDYEDLVKIIWIGVLSTYMGFISGETNEAATHDDKLNADHEHMDLEGDGADAYESIDESIMDYPELFNFLKKEAMHYVEKKYEPNFYDDGPKHLESVIEKAIFYGRCIFNGYFEVTDARCEFAKSMDDEEDLDSKAPLKNRKFEFRSNMISHACGNIDKAMRKLHRRVAKEPYFWVMASYNRRNI
ncbi:MAG: hypothetical protein ACOX5W_10935 [Bacillota bacterium]|jgi:ACT domain-containing protein